MNKELNPKISCVIPTCDRYDFLCQAIKSILAQTFQPCEIIIVNNGRDRLVLDEALLQRVVVYNIVPYAGGPQARNFGASIAKGDYIAFLDDDDLWGQAYLENVSKAIERGELCIVSRLDTLSQGKVSLYKNAGKDLTIKNLLTYNPGVTGSNIVINRKLFFEISGFDPKLSSSQDKNLLIEVLRRNIKVKVLSDNQAIYRQHAHHFVTSNPNTLAQGMHCFTKKYSYLMGPREYLYNWLKIYRNRYRAGRKIAGFQFIFVKFIFSLIKMFGRQDAN